MRKNRIEEEVEEQRYRVLIDHAPEAVVILDASTGRFIDFNENALDLFGISREALRTMGPVDLSPSKVGHRDASDYSGELIREALRGGNPVFDWIHLDSEEREIPCEVRLVRFPPYDRQLVRASIIDISERRRMKEALEKSEERLQLALQATELGSFDWCLRDQKLLWDERMHQLFGLPAGSDLDKKQHFLDILHPDDQARIKNNLEQMLASQWEDFFYKEEFRILLAGNVRHINSSGLVFRDENGIVIRLVGTCRDVTDSRRREALFRKTTERLEEAQRIARLGNFEADLATRTTWWSQGMYQIFETTPEALTPNLATFMEHVHPDDREKVGRQIEICIREGADQRLSYRLQLPGGRVKYMADIIRGIKNREGRVTGLIGTSQDVTEQKQVTDRLRFQGALLDNVSDAVVATDLDFRVLSWNRAAEELYGWRAEEVTGKLFNEVVPIRYTSQAREEVIAEFLEKGEWRGEVYQQNRNGEELYVLSSVTTRRDSDGSPIGAIAVNRDITEWKQAEEARRASEARYRALAENFPNGLIALFDPDLRYSVVNGEGLAQIGLRPADLEGKRLRDLFPPEVYERDEPALRAALAGETVERIVSYGDAVFRVITLPVRDDRGEVISGMVMSQNITELKRTEAELQRALKQLQLVIDTAKLGIWDWDLETDTLVWDDTMFALYSVDRATFSGNSSAWQSRLHPDDRPALRQAIIQALKGEKEFDRAFRVLWPDQSVRYIKVLATVQRDEQGRAVRMLGANWDITKEKEAEQQRLRARQLELKNKELEQFAYVASHDLQEPLRTVIGFVELLRRNYQEELDDKAGQYLQFISQAANRMSKLISGLLEYSRIGQKRELTEVDCRCLVDHLLEDLGARIAETKAVIEVEPLPRLKGYETELRVLFQNLLSNALKFRREDTTPLIRIAVREEKQEWTFSVSDNGIGIESRYQEKIFVIFQRLHPHNKYEGTGIGLAHCQKIMDLHGGRIWVESTPGKGSTFYFTIPK